MDYIRYQETEELFKIWPLLEGILESLKVDLVLAQSKARNRDKLATEEDYILSMAYGNKSLDSGPPPVGKISDTTGSIAMNYSKVMDQDKNNYIEEWNEFEKETGEEYLALVAVIDKLAIAFRKLTQLQQSILKQYYWENKVWKEVRASVSNEKDYKSESALKVERTRAINKMAVILSNSMEYTTYQRIMKMIETKKEGQ